MEDEKKVGTVKETVAVVKRQSEDPTKNFNIKLSQENNSAEKDSSSNESKIIGTTKEILSVLREYIKNTTISFNKQEESNVCGVDTLRLPLDLEKIEKLKEIKENFSQFDLLGEEYICRISAEKLFELFLLGDKKEFHLNNNNQVISCSSYLKEKNIYVFINLVQDQNFLCAEYTDVHPSYITLDSDIHGAILGKELKEITYKIENFFNSYYQEYLFNGGNTEVINICKILYDKKVESFFSIIFKKVLSYFNEFKENNNLECLNDELINSYILNKNKVKIIKIYG